MLAHQTVNTYEPHEYSNGLAEQYKGNGRSRYSSRSSGLFKAVVTYSAPSVG